MKNIDFPIIFTHIPRTGGTTFQEILKNNFPLSQQFNFKVNESGTTQESLALFHKMTTEDREKFTFLTGHINFGIHEYYNNPCTYITLIRNPVSRIVSYYHLILADKRHFLHDTIIKNRMTLNELLISRISTEFNNAQVRQLSGETGKCNESTLEKAIENLEKFYPVFGLTERYNESMVLLSKYFDFPFPYYLLLNEGKNKQISKITEEAKEVIYETNSLDIKLYKYATNRFQNLIDLQGADFVSDVTKFEKNNNFLRKVKINNSYFGISLWNFYARNIKKKYK